MTSGYFCETLCCTACDVRCSSIGSVFSCQVLSIRSIDAERRIEQVLSGLCTVLRPCQQSIGYMGDVTGTVTVVQLNT